jgi:ribosomal protein S18 acetylase RimI-like enzyme
VGEPSVTIRTATSDDDEVLVALDDATRSPAVTPAPEPRPGRRFFTHTAPGDVLVAGLDGVVVGYAMLHQPIPVPSHAHVLEVNGLAVDPAHQGRGVGRALVEAAQAEAVRRGARKLGLRVLGTNPAARRLYEACGFVVEGVLRGEFRIGGVEVDDVLMAWRPAGAAAPHRQT